MDRQRMNSRIDTTRNEPMVFRASFAMAFIRFLQRIVPAVVSSTMLLVLCLAYGVPIDQKMIILAAVSAILALLLIRSGRDYSVNFGNPRTAMAISIVQRWLLLLGVLLLLAYSTKWSAVYSRRVVLTWSVATPAALTLLSFWLQDLMDRAMADISNQRTALFVGINEASTVLADKLRKNVQQSMRVIGFFDDRSAERLGVDHATPLLGRLSDVVDYVHRHSIGVIFIALPIRHIKRVLDLVDQLRDTTASIYYLPDIYVFDLIQAQTRDILDVPVIAMCETPFSGYRGVSKRMLDLAVTLGLLPLLLPLLLAIAIGVKLSSGGPVIFRQRRYGLDGREIVVYKFRTMRVTEDSHFVQQAVQDDPRVTPFGGFLRRWSMDELPQLFNVLGGSMSLVGPRPHAVAHNEQYRKLIKGYMIRHKVPPGITGLAQIKGCRGETAQLEQMQARVNYDLEYLRRWSPQLDIQILVATVFQLSGRGKAY